MVNKHVGTTLDSFVEELGELEEVGGVTAKKILSLQTERHMKELGLTTTTLVAGMGTSRNQVHRVPDEDDAGITLKAVPTVTRAPDAASGGMRRGARYRRGGSRDGP